MPLRPPARQPATPGDYAGQLGHPTAYLGSRLSPAGPRARMGGGWEVGGGLEWLPRDDGNLQRWRRCSGEPRH